jgi:hypothetical protein
MSAFALWSFIIPEKMKATTTFISSFCAARLMVRFAEGPVRGREWAAATDRVPVVESETPVIYKTTKLI